ncbi:dihydrolipoamide acetyltransferase family protein [Bacillus andreraoultii]|uniref:dihydrolipoamide acetyltransferase family protein n=1 Tax=Bacillus andreraoultii TaxID=1499685 RepID=UPI00053AE6B8|nr:dihydrolipoamide acetyltransferase family protein [Bacillus andreraoultii]
MGLMTITMPQLGESVTEGTITNWLVTPGDHVQKYDPLAEVLTDKVTAEIPSSYTGKIKELIAKVDETLAVGEVICTIETDEVEAEASPSLPTEDFQAKVSSNMENRESTKQRYSPAVLKLASEHNIDLANVVGTGRGGRITRKDIQKIIDSGVISSDQSPRFQHSSKDSSTLQNTNEIKPIQNRINQGDREIPVTGIRKTIASNMTKAKQEIPHAWMMMEADVTELVNYRNEIKDEFYSKEGYSLTYFAFFVKTVAQTLKEFPELNSTWAGDKIIHKKDINLSIAVATDDALFVPVIKHADEKSIKGIAREIHELATKVRTGRLQSEDLQGGTFTINNTGSFGSVQSMGIINYPQAAILQVESIVKKLVVMDNGMVAVRDMVNLCLSLDHRVLDGFICGKFLKKVKERLETMTKENISIY